MCLCAYISHIVKIPVIEKQKVLNIVRKFPTMHLSGIQKNHRARFDFIFLKINFVLSKTFDKEKNSVKIMFMRFFNPRMMILQMIRKSVGINLLVYFLVFKIFDF